MCELAAGLVPHAPPQAQPFLDWLREADEESEEEDSEGSSEDDE